MKRRPFLERFASRKQVTRAVVGVAWYGDAQTWSEVKAFAEDPDRFEDSYAEWEAMASESIATFAKQGTRLVKVPVVPTNFGQWLETRSKKNDASARAEYASQMLRDSESAT